MPNGNKGKDTPNYKRYLLWAIPLFIVFGQYLLGKAGILVVVPAANTLSDYEKLILSFIIGLTTGGIFGLIGEIYFYIISNNLSKEISKRLGETILEDVSKKIESLINSKLNNHKEEFSRIVNFPISSPSNGIGSNIRKFINSANELNTIKWGSIRALHDMVDLHVANLSIRVSNVPWNNYTAFIGNLTKEAKHTLVWTMKGSPLSIPQKYFVNGKNLTDHDIWFREWKPDVQSGIGVKIRIVIFISKEEVGTYLDAKNDCNDRVSHFEDSVNSEESGGKLYFTTVGRIRRWLFPSQPYKDDLDLSLVDFGVFDGEILLQANVSPGGKGDIKMTLKDGLDQKYEELARELFANGRIVANNIETAQALGCIFDDIQHLHNSIIAKQTDNMA